jgi:hypothetical protein
VGALISEKQRDSVRGRGDIEKKADSILLSPSLLFFSRNVDPFTRRIMFELGSFFGHSSHASTSIAKGALNALVIA